jgi:hypothetical protein
MIGRRGAIYRIGAGILGVASALAKRLNAAEAGANTTQASEFGEQLVRELTRLENRVYSEQGIPMFLACKNLARSGNDPPDSPVARPSSAPLAAAFRRCVETLPQIRADVTENDVAKLVELLADQDFTAGGTKFSP